MEDLEYILKKLKRNKSRDALGYTNEIFLIDVAGDDLKQAILKLLNKMKNQHYLPKELQKVNITSVYKSKAKNDFNNYRGIFCVPVIRSIFDKLMYNDSYLNIDKNITDGSNGARNSRGPHDNIFILNSVINSVINGFFNPVQIE